MKTFYSDYVQHCMRFYARYTNPEFYNVVDELNWYACDDALKDFADIQRDTLLAIYRSADTIPSNIRNLSVTKGFEQDAIWKLVNSLERKVAEKRGLI